MFRQTLINICVAWNGLFSVIQRVQVNIVSEPWRSITQPAFVKSLTNSLRFILKSL